MIGLHFMRLGILSLAIGMFFGVIGGFQFLFPDFIKELLFTKTRALHVSMVVSWIFLVAIGGVYHYLPKYAVNKLYSSKLASWHYWLFLLTGIAVVGSYLSGKFGGREYFAFPPLLTVASIASEIAMPRLPGLSGLSLNNFFPNSVNSDGLGLHFASKECIINFL